jgi:CheY-like chemotaxis protein
VRQRIFDPFFSTKGAEGTGMGLAMAYGITQRHHGTIAVESSPGQGSTFQVRLPVRRLAPALPIASAAAAPAQPLRILAVEDDEGVRRVLVQILRRAGHSVVDVASGLSAIALIEGGGFDLLCTDLGMPGMSGWDLVAQARVAQPALMTILITGWGEQIAPDEAQRRGVDAVVAKPFDAARLRQTIVNLQLRLAAHSDLSS